jgi:hypothetical protein
MKGEYRFLKVKGGRCYFAHAEVEVTPGGKAIEVFDALPERTDPGTGEVARGTDPSSWVSAALDGIREALGYSGLNGVAGTSCRAALVRLVGTVADTRADVVRCTAGLAAWRALGREGPGPEAVFDGRLWTLQYPAPVPSPGEGVSS